MNNAAQAKHWDSNEKESDSSSIRWLKHPRWWGNAKYRDNLLLHRAVGVFAFVFSVLIVAGGKSAAEPGPQQIGKAFGKADMTWRFFEVHKDASTWCINHIFMYFIRWVNVRFVTTTAEAMPKQHLQWSAFQQRRPRDAAISDGWTFRLRLCRDGAINIPLKCWKIIFMPITKYFDRSFGFWFFESHPESLLQTSQRPLGQTLAWQRSCLPRHVEHICHGG